LAKKRKIPQILKQIKNQPLREMNYAFEKAISYSQFSVFQSCPRKWSLQYRDGHYTSESSIYMTFGTALHETLQHYITTIYEQSGAAADRIDLKEYFEDRFRETYLKDYKSNKNIHFSDSVEMNEFFEDGIAILNFVKKKRASYFGKRGWHLVGCELPLVITPNPKYPNILYKGYLDVVLYHEDTNKIKILDIKTSTKGWSDKEKKDEIKQFQLILYKKFFSQQYNISVDDIEVEFFIVKRKVWENSDFPISRIQEFRPASGKVKLNKAYNAVNEFIGEVFNSDGSHNSRIHLPRPSAHNCRFCPFKDNKELCDKGLL
jgi:hypothetical protein